MGNAAGRYRRVEEAGQGLILFFRRGLTAPLRALAAPRRLYEWIGEAGSRYGPFFTLPFFLGVWLGLAFVTILLVAMAGAVRSIAGGDLAGLLMAPLRALVYALVFPTVYALLDSVIIIIILWILRAETRRPLHLVFAVRASSGIPYTLKAGLHALAGDLSALGLIAYCSLGQMILGLAGAGLTAYGLEHTLGARRIHAVVPALAVYMYKVALCHA